MRRFFKAAAAVPAGDRYRIELDGRPVRTPARAPLELPSSALADAIAAEWNGQGEEIDARSMPLTGLANAAIDRVGQDHDALARGLAAYGATDLLCYRSDEPRELVRRQSDAWDPILSWARRRYDIDFEIACGIVHRPQPATTVERLAKAVAARGPFELAGLSPLVTISGSLVIALALAEGGVDRARAWEAATLDEAWQAERWGRDDLAEAALEVRRSEFEAAHLFLTLLDRPGV